MKYTHIIWDFNGTIFCDMEAGIVSVNTMLCERGLKSIEGIEAYREIFDFPIKEYYRSLGFDFEKEPYSVLAQMWVDLYNENLKGAGLCQGAEATLLKIKEKGLEQIVLSACEVNMLTAQLEALGVKQYFSEIIGLDNIHAQGKLSLAEEWRNKNGQAKALIVGDTTHDALVARTIGADCLLYSGGHQSKKRLSECGFPIIDKLEDIIKFL